MSRNIGAFQNQGRNIGAYQSALAAGYDETLPPDTIALQINLAGAVTDIDEPVDSPDANWLTYLE